MLYELAINRLYGVSFKQLEVTQRTPKQFKVKGSTQYRSVVNDSETNRILHGTRPEEYVIWFTDLNDLPKFKKEILEVLEKDFARIERAMERIKKDIQIINELEGN